MSELALYRKYRPGRFSEVVGQAHVVTVLQGALKAGNVAHAYLFAGSRGTGKTSVARILARELDTKPEDLYEVDGASNRGIDEIRALREAVRSLPFASPYKVYIIDEVHMLTKDAFNALLKTLEEPPAHVIFILATTELHKVLDTIVSRCQTFTFKKPTLEELQKAVTSAAKKEGWTIDAGSAELIALLAEGSFRDALGLLQKIAAVSPDKKIVLAEVEAVTGAPTHVLVGQFVTAVAKGEQAPALEAIAALVEKNTDIKIFIKLALRFVRQGLLQKVAPRLAGEEKVALDAPVPKLVALLRELLESHEATGRAVVAHLPLELAVLRLTQN